MKYLQRRGGWASSEEWGAITPAGHRDAGREQSPGQRKTVVLRRRTQGIPGARQGAKG